MLLQFHSLFFLFSTLFSAAILKRWKLCMQVVYCRLNAFIECWTAECLSLDSYWRRPCRCHRCARERKRNLHANGEKRKNCNTREREIHREISEWRHPTEAAGSWYKLSNFSFGFIHGCEIIKFTGCWNITDYNPRMQFSPTKLVK